MQGSHVMKYTARFTGIAFALLSVLAMCGCHPQATGSDGFPPPQPEPAAAKAAAAAQASQTGAPPPRPPANTGQAKPQ